MPRLLRLAITATLLALPVAAEAKKKDGDLIDGTNIDAIVEIAKGYGQATIDKDGQGDPMIKCQANGLKYSVYFYGCEKGKNCTSIQLLSGFNTDGKADLDKVLEWNSKKRWLKAVRDDEGDPIVRYDIMLAGGVTTANLSRSFNLFVDMLSDFSKHIGERERD